MNKIQNWKSAVLDASSAADAHRGERIQSLWSGYGEIVRIELQGARARSVILKAIDLPQDMQHPRGWNGELSHQRKVRSYEVERNWYANYASCCDESCRVPHCFGAYVSGHQQWIILEDLDRAGFSKRRTGLSVDEAKVCLQWLAAFHAKFLGSRGQGLWEQGTYWHLQTRPDELAAMTDARLQVAAASLDQALSGCRYMTLVHGDAKLANFCFSSDLSEVAAVDFQYVGRGCGMKDVAYFLGSCLAEQDCARFEEELLKSYFVKLQQALVNSKVSLDFAELESEWRMLYPLAWTDFYRFLQGWSPEHYKINQYTLTMCEQALRQIGCAD